MIEDSEFTTQVSADNSEMLLGSGGTADCYKRIIGNHTYCIKRPKPQYRSSDDYMNLFRKEFELGIELEHPNIVRYFDYGEDERGPFIKMDFVDGDGLDEFVAKHPDFLSNKQNRQRLLNELLDALAYLHGKRMLHLDLKPNNILITNHGHHVKLVDLGFAWTDGYLHDAGFSRDYCAPEQLANKANQISPATDIYALGRIMQRFRLAPSAVIKKCLKEQPEDRFQSITEVQKAIIRPKRLAVVLSALVLSISVATLFTHSIQRQRQRFAGFHNDTVFVHQVDTVFIETQAPVMTLEDSLAVFKDELKNALAPTFVYWYGLIDNMFENQPDLPKELHLEYSEFYIEKGVSASQNIIKERINILHLSSTAKPHYEKAAQEVIDYYLKDYRQLKQQLEQELKEQNQ